MRYSKIALCAIVTATLLCAPLWLSTAHRLFPRTIFLTPAALVWLGLTLLGGILASCLLPDSTVEGVKGVCRAVQSRATLFLCLFIPMLVIALGAINHLVLLRFMNSADEHSCYFLAQCIRSGKWWATSPPLADFFDVVHVGDKAGKWFSVYPPGWPLLFAVGLRFHIADWMNPLIAGAAVLLLYKVGKNIFTSSTALLGLVLMCTSPFFLLNCASYFSHTTCLLAIAVFLVTYLKWTRGKNVGWAAALCGFSLGYGLGTRYLTMAAVAAPFLVYKAARLLCRRERFHWSHATFALVLSGMIGLNLYYNYLITGHFLEAPNHYYHDWERLGFSPDYPPLEALKYIIARLFFLTDWTAPALLILYIISLFTWRKAHVHQRLFLYGFVCLLFSYALYFSWGGNQYGPRYCFEGLPFLALSAAYTIRRWWLWEKPKTQKFLIGVALVSLLGNGYLLFKQGSFYHEVSRQRRALYVLAQQTVTRPAIVFIRGFLGDLLVMAEEDAVRNDPDLRGDILYAHDRGEKNGALIKLFPDRTCYLGYYDRDSKQARLRNWGHTP